MTTKQEKTPVDVTWEDQQQICIFSRVHRRVQYLQKRRQLLTDDLEKLEDASTEVMISDEVRYVFGESFVDLDADRTGELLDADKERLLKEKAEVEEELKDLDDALTELKARLYAKFGNQIYLEDK